MFGISLARISLLTGTSLGGGVGVSPTLDLNFRGQGYSAAMAGYTFNQLIDFTRTSAGTYVDASGKIVSTPASRNLLTFTQEFDNAGWGKTGATVTANAATAPDGTLTADALVENSATSGHYVSETVTGTAVGTTYTASVYAKPNGRNWIILEMNGATTYASFNVATGAVGTLFGSPTATITSVGNGWYRCSITKTIGAAITSIRVYAASADNTDTYAGNGTSGVFLWGAQLEANTTATDYTRNNGGVFPPRFDYDPVTLAPRGLLVEEQRTNLLVRSEEFDNASWVKTGVTVTANSAASPAGTATADTLTASSANGTVVQSVSTTAVAMTFSIYLKRKTGTGNIQISADGSTWVTQAIDSTNWTRCIVTQTAVAGTTSPGLRIVTSGDEVYGWGAQYE